jgi:hypothetical protein
MMTLNEYTNVWCIFTDSVSSMTNVNQDMTIEMPNVCLPSYIHDII